MTGDAVARLEAEVARLRRQLADARQALAQFVRAAGALPGTNRPPVHAELLERMSDGVLVHDGGVILHANAALARMLGYEPRQLGGRRLLDLVPPEQRELLPSHGVAQGELCLVRADGADVAVTITPLSQEADWQGRAARLALVQVDARLGR